MESSSCSYPMSYEYSKYLFYSSFLIGVSAGFSLYYKDSTSFCFLFLLFLSSINHWYKPVYGLKRDIDLFICKAISVYFYGNTLFFYDEFCREVYLNGLYSVLFLFFMEYLCFYFKIKKWIIFHMAIHFYLAVFTPFVLYLL